MHMKNNEVIEFHADGTATVTKDSGFTGKRHTMTLKMTEAQYNNWVFGKTLVQVALPHLTPSEREFLMTGVTDEEWNATFKDHDDDEPESD